jgi:mutator protein MutT
MVRPHFKPSRSIMTSPPNPLDVVAGILIEDGRVLLAQRTADQSFPLCWEFPGGKVEEGERPEEALVREFEEEMGFAISARAPYAEVNTASPTGRTVRVRFFLVERVAGTPQPVEVAAVEWVELNDLGRWNVIPTNLAVVERLMGDRVTG